MYKNKKYINKIFHIWIYTCQGRRVSKIQNISISLFFYPGLSHCLPQHNWFPTVKEHYLWKEIDCQLLKALCRWCFWPVTCVPQRKLKCLLPDREVFCSLFICWVEKVTNFYNLLSRLTFFVKPLNTDRIVEQPYQFLQLLVNFVLQSREVGGLHRSNKRIK